LELINVQVDSDKIFLEILNELRNISKTNKENIIAIKQLTEYLKDYQAVTDFQLKDVTKQNHSIVREIKLLIAKASILADPNVATQSRMVNNRIISSNEDPVYTVSESVLNQYAESNVLAVYNTVYYRTGYLLNLGTSFQTIDEGFPDYMGATQLLRIASTSVNDKFPTGTGIQAVLVGGIGSNGLRYTEYIQLNGTTSVTTTGQFAQIDLFYSVGTGTSGGAVGTITVTGVTDTIAYAAIQPTFNSWQSGRFFTDSQASAYVDAWNFGSFSNAVRANLRTANVGGNTFGLTTKASVIIQNSTVQLLFPVPIRAVSSGLVMVRGISKNPATEVSTSFELHYVNNES